MNKDSNRRTAMQNEILIQINYLGELIDRAEYFNHISREQHSKLQQLYSTLRSDAVEVLTNDAS